MYSYPKFQIHDTGMTRAGYMYTFTIHVKALDRIGGAIFGCGLPVLFLVVVPVHVTRTGKSQPRTGHTRALSHIPVDLIAKVAI